MIPANVSCCNSHLSDDVIDLDGVGVLEFGGWPDGATGRQDEVVLEEADWDVESLHLHGRHLVVFEALVQSKQISQNQVLHVATDQVNVAILRLAGGEAKVEASL